MVHGPPSQGPLIAFAFPAPRHERTLVGRRADKRPICVAATMHSERSLTHYEDSHKEHEGRGDEV